MRGSGPRMTISKSKALLASIAIALTFCTAALAAGFSGNFNGIATATGMSLNLQEVAGRVVGRLGVPGGRSYAINGERTAKGAQGTLRLGGAAQGVAYFRMEERPLGVQFLFIPAQADGKANLGEAREYSFVVEGVALPAKSKFLAAPGAGEKVDILRFIDEYRSWDPRDVARIYASLDERSQGLIQLYDHASADVLWRICAASAAGAEIPEKVMNDVLDRQQTSCADFLPLAEAAQKGGLFPEFQRRASFQFEIIRETVLCNRGENAPTKCADVSALGAPLIVHWRDASSIMRELAGLPAPAPDDAGAPGTLAPYAPQAGGAEPPKPPKPQVETPGLRPTIVEAQAAKSDRQARIAALKLYFKAKRRGFRTPLPNPHR